MNVLHLHPQGEFGGAPRILLDWIRHSQVRNVVVVGGGGPLVGRLERQGCTVYAVRFWRPRNVWSLVAEVAAIVEREQIDLIHSCNCDGHMLGGLLRLRTGRPEIWFNHGPMERVAWSRFARFLPTEALLVASRSMERDQRAAGCWAKRLDLLPLGIDGEAFREDPAARAAMRARLGLEDEICLAMVARFDPIKGQAVLARALGMVRQRRPAQAFKVLFVGGLLQAAEAVAYEREVKKLVRELGLADRTVFTGHVDNVADYLNAADLVVQATVVPESFGLSVVEAMAMQKVILAPSEGGPVDIIRDGEDGFLFPPRNPAALADLIVTIIDGLQSHPERLAAVTLAARRKVLNRYAIVTSTRALEQIYRRVVDARNAVAPPDERQQTRAAR